MTSLAKTGFGEGGNIVGSSPIESNLINPLFVDSVTGASGSFEGYSRRRPLPTLQDALSKGGGLSGQPIIILKTHRETLSAQISINAGRIIIGEGEPGSDEVPTFECDSEIESMFKIATTQVQLSNIKLNLPADSDTMGIYVTADEGFVKNTLLEDISIEANSGSATGLKLDVGIENTRINRLNYSIVESVENKPSQAIVMSDSAGIEQSSVYMKDCTIDAGEIGFSSSTYGPNTGVILGTNEAFAFKKLMCTGLRLLGGAFFACINIDCVIIQVDEASVDSRVAII